MSLPRVNPKMRNIAGKRSRTLREALLSALASRTDIRLKTEVLFTDVFVLEEQSLCFLIILIIIIDAYLCELLNHYYTSLARDRVMAFLIPICSFDS